MKHETRLFILGALVALSIFCGLFLMLAAQPAMMQAPAGKSIPLAEAPFFVKALVGLAALISGGLVLAPVFQAEPKILHKEKPC